MASVTSDASASASSVPQFRTDKGDILLRVQLPNGNTTMIQISSEIIMWKVLDVICTKKDIPTATIKDMKVLYNGKEEEVQMERQLSYYATNLERVILVADSNSKENSMPASPKLDPITRSSTHLANALDMFSFGSKAPPPVIGLPTLPPNSAAPDGASSMLQKPAPMRRRTSVMNAQTSKQTIRASSQEFPATLTDEKDLKARMATTNAGSGKVGESLWGRNKFKMKTLSRNLFVKKQQVVDSPISSIQNSPAGSMCEREPPSGGSSLGAEVKVEITQPNSTANTASRGEHNPYMNIYGELSGVLEGSMLELNGSQPCSIQGSNVNLDNSNANWEIQEEDEMSSNGGVNSSNGKMFVSPSMPADKSRLAVIPGATRSGSCLLARTHSSSSTKSSNNSVDKTGDSIADGLQIPAGVGRSLDNIDKQNRKRTVSTPVAGGGTPAKGAASQSSFNLSTKRILSKARPRSESVRNQEEERQQQQSGEKKDTISEAPGRAITLNMKIASASGVAPQYMPINTTTDTLVEVILLQVCTSFNLDFDEYTIQFTLTPNTLILMDKPLSTYIDEKVSVVDLTVRAGEKNYDMLCVNENGIDVMILKNVPEKGNLIMASTTEKLIEKATDPSPKNQNNETDFLETLLMTYRSFMKPMDFLDELIARFNAELPDDPTQEDIDYFAKHKKPTQKKVVQVLTYWIEKHWHDFGLDDSLKKDLEEFTLTSLTNDNDFKKDSVELTWTITSQSRKFEDLINSTKNVHGRGKAMQSMIHDVSHEDLAQQLCLHNFKLFRNIHPIEFLNQIWVKPTEDSVSPSLDFFIARFDKESYWVCTEIVMVKDLKKRTSVLKNFILTAKKCQEYKNFFTTFAIIAGLNLSPVQRLKKTWDALPDKAKKAFAELEKLIDPSKNMKNFRDLLAKAKPPIVPFLPIYLKDLTFMNDGNQSTVRNMINFDKLRMMANRVKDISGLASTEYKFESKSAIQNYIAKPPIEKSITKLKELALECEPRN